MSPTRLATQVEGTELEPPAVFRQGDARNDAIVRRWLRERRGEGAGAP